MSDKCDNAYASFRDGDNNGDDDDDRDKYADHTDCDDRDAFREWWVANDDNKRGLVVVAVMVVCAVWRFLTPRDISTRPGGMRDAFQ